MTHPIYRGVIPGSCLNIQILNQGLIASTRPSVPYVVISISGSGMIPAKVNSNPNRYDVLHVTFDDVEEDDISNTIPISDFKASEIAYFVLSRYSEIDLLLINCQAGLSRSAGVGAAISKCLNDDDSAFFKHYRPNMLVYRKVYSAFEYLIHGDSSDIDPELM